MKSRLTVLFSLLLSMAGTEAKADEGRLFSSDCLTSTLTTCAEQDRTVTKAFKHHFGMSPTEYAAK